MKKATQIVAFLLFFAAFSWSQEGAAKTNLRPGGGVPKKGLPKIAKKGPPPGRPNAPNPNVDRLLAMSPEQRERVLEKLPAGRQVNIRKSLAKFDALPPEERALQLERLKRWEGLTPEKRALLTEHLQALKDLPTERALPVRRALNQLRELGPEERKARLAAPAFARRFSPAEIEIITDLVENSPTWAVR